TRPQPAKAALRALNCGNTPTRTFRPRRRAHGARCAAGVMQEGPPSMDKKIIRIGDSKFPYFFGDDCLDEIGHKLNELSADRFIVVTDNNVAGLYLDAFLDAIGTATPVTVLSHEPGESMKSLSCLSDYLDRAFADGISRRSVVI